MKVPVREVWRAVRRRRQRRPSWTHGQDPVPRLQAGALGVARGAGRPRPSDAEAPVTSARPAPRVEGSALIEIRQLAERMLSGRLGSAREPSARFAIEALMGMPRFTPAIGVPLPVPARPRLPVWVLLLLTGGIAVVGATAALRGGGVALHAAGAHHDRPPRSSPPRRRSRLVRPPSEPGPRCPALPPPRRRPRRARVSSPRPVAPWRAPQRCPVMKPCVRNPRPPMVSRPPAPAPPPASGTAAPRREASGTISSPAAAVCSRRAAAMAASSTTTTCSGSSRAPAARAPPAPPHAPPRRPRAASTPSLPDQPDRAEITGRLRQAQAGARACFLRYHVPGTATVQVVIGGSGHVTSARVTGPLARTPTGDCVEHAVRETRFQAFRGSPYSLTCAYVLH